MRTMTMRYMATWTLGAAILAAATWVGAWSTVGNSPFTLPTATAKNPPVWMPPPPGGPKRVGVRVQTTSGKVNVKAGPSSGSNASVGSVPAGASALFEGDYGYLNIEADGGPATGNYVHKELGQPSDADQDIGQGSLTLPLQPGNINSFAFYGGDSARCRVATVQAGNAPVTVQDGLGSNLVQLEANDWTCCVCTVAQYKVQGSGTVNWLVGDTPTGPNAFTWVRSGTASAQTAGDQDKVAVDGSTGVQVTLSNNNAAGTISVTCVGGAPSGSLTIPAGQSASFAGNLTSLVWAYSAAGMQVGLVVQRY